MTPESAAARLHELVRNDRLEPALRGLTDLFAALGTDMSLAGRPFPFPQFDAACAAIGAASAFELFRAAPGPATPHDLVLLTEAFVQGGHAEIIGDLATWSERPLRLVATNLNDRKSPILPELARHPRVADTTVCDAPDLLGRLRSVQAAVANPAAQRVLVLCHGNDAVAIAGCAAAGKTVLFFHHCDHAPCLGCFMPDAEHVDLHNLAFHACRDQLGLDPAYLCLTSRDGPPRAAGRPGDPVFKSVSCGQEHKLQRLAYPLTYRDVVVRLVTAHHGVHFHVGPLSDTFIAAIAGALEQAGLPRDAFVPVGHVGGFREIVAALEADLYLPTLPQAGGKALIDAMAAGVPILVHENAIDRLWGGRDLVYPEAPGWTGLDGLDTALARFADGDYWRTQAAASRAYYERHHANALFAAMLRANGRLARSCPPPLKPYRPGLGERMAARALLAGAS
jgi:hypothetical protein